jgi:hypothetical protein
MKSGFLAGLLKKDGRERFRALRKTKNLLPVNWNAIMEQKEKKQSFIPEFSITHL